MRTIKGNKNKNKNSKGRKRQHNNKNYGHNMYKDKIMINKEKKKKSNQGRHFSEFINAFKLKNTLLPALAMWFCKIRQR